jgi:hypothetical protein
MKISTAIAIILASGIAAPLWAMSSAAAAIDANGDGVLTIDEVQAAFPDISTEGFEMMDLNADGTLQDDEVTAAEEAGLMPTNG